MARNNNRLQKVVNRSTMYTITAILIMGFFVPVVMGSTSAWNDWIGDNSGRSYTIRSESDLISIDYNASYNGDIIFRHLYDTSDVVYTDQLVTYGNTTNLGYHTWDLFGNNTGNVTLDADYSAVYLRLNITGRQLRENESVSLFFDVAGFGGIVPQIKVYLHDAGAELAAMTDPEDVYQIGDTVIHDSALNGTVATFETIQYEFSYLDLVTAEDKVGYDNYVLVEIMAADGSLLEEGDTCYLRTYDSALNNFGTMNTESSVRFVHFLTGLFLLVGGIFSTANVSVQGPGLKQSVKTEIQRYKDTKVQRNKNFGRQ